MYILYTYTGVDYYIGRTRDEFEILIIFLVKLDPPKTATSSYNKYISANTIYLILYLLYTLGL